MYEKVVIYPQIIIKYIYIQLSPAPTPPKFTYLSLSNPPLKFVIFALSKFVSVNVQNCKFAININKNNFTPL